MRQQTYTPTGQSAQYNQRGHTTRTEQNHHFNQNQAVMEKPPAVISTKDLLYIKDALSWELTAMKKCAFFAQKCKCPEIQHAVNRAGEMHSRHYKMLLKHLNPNKTV